MRSTPLRHSLVLSALLVACSSSGTGSPGPDGTSNGDAPSGPRFAASQPSRHNYFAGGVLVHNKAVGVPLGEGQPWNGQFWRRAAKP